MADQSKPYDIHVDSVTSVPKISNIGGVLNDGRHGLVDFDMHWHTNNNLGEIRTQWHALFLVKNHDIPRGVLFIGDGKYAKSYDVPSSMETCAEALEYIEQRNGNSHKDGLTMKLNIECGEAIKGLKAVQREARKATQALKELDSVKAGVEHE